MTCVRHGRPHQERARQNMGDQNEAVVTTCRIVGGDAMWGLAPKVLDRMTMNSNTAKMTFH